MVAAIVFVAGCGRAGGAPEPREIPAGNRPSAEKQDDDGSREDEREAEVPVKLRQLQKYGRFEEFVDAALNAADEHPDDPSLQLVKAEALLAVGRDQDAEAASQRAAELALAEDDVETCGVAAKRWSTARFRQRKPLSTEWFEKLAAEAPDDPIVHLLKFWAGALGEREPYRTRGTENEAPQTAVVTDSDGLAGALNAIQARANGVVLPTVFIDTGSQHVIMTSEAAKAAGVQIGPSGIRLVGFAHLVARPALVETLELGGVTLHDVPVLVGDSPPLVAAKGQMTLGTELMHHVRFTIDYPAGNVSARGANDPRPVGSDGAAWEIPVWTFSQICLAQGRMDNGALARVLIDTGDRQGSYVSTRWAQRNLPGFPRTAGPVLFKVKHPHLRLDKMDLGNDSLRDWPLIDTLPRDLERIDAVDLLLGHDLLADYRVTFDLARRVVRLETSGEPADEAAARYTSDASGKTGEDR